MKGLVVCNSLDHFLSGVTRLAFRPFSRDSHHPQPGKENEVSLGGEGEGKEAGRGEESKEKEQDRGANVHTRCTANSSRCNALTIR